MISIVIPHYKESGKLYANLTQNLPFCKGCEIIVVNDYPNVSLKKEMKTLFPEIVLIENKRNLGFAGAVSVGIQHAKSPYILLMNNDVVLKDDSFKSALTLFEGSADLFAVSFKQVEKEGSVVGRNKIFWKNGFFQHSKADPTKTGINGWAEGGSMLFDKKKYEKLNGFDTLYSPFYWEDIDLSYRAWKAGYTILFGSEVVVNHRHESTIGAYFQKSDIASISYRNQLITIWKNIADSAYLTEHVLYLLKSIVLSPFRDQGVFIKGFWMAFLLLPKIMKKRGLNKGLWKKSDREIFEKFTIE